MAVARTMPEAGIESWTDIDRLDVRPDKGMLKVHAKKQLAVPSRVLEAKARAT